MGKKGCSSKRMKKGGPVRGPGGPRSDSIPARLSPGEWVAPADTVQQVGLQNLERLRQMTHRFADGGSLDTYGNDLSLTNRMKAGADAMKKAREGGLSGYSAPTEPPDTGVGGSAPPPPPMGLSGFFNPATVAPPTASSQNKPSWGAVAEDAASQGYTAAPAFQSVNNLGSLGGNFQHGGPVQRFQEGGNVLTPSQLKNLNNYEDFSRTAPPRLPVDDYGNQWTGRGSHARPVMGAPSEIPVPPTPNGSAESSPIRLAPKATPLAPATGLAVWGPRIAGAATSPVGLAGSGIAAALYPSELGKGTLDSPEAQKQIAANRYANNISWVNDVPGFKGSEKSVQASINSAPKPVAPTPDRRGTMPVTPPPLGAAHYPNDNTISNLGDSVAAQELAKRTQGARLVAQGDRPLGEYGSTDTPVYAGNSTQTGQSPIGNKPVYTSPYYDAQGKQIASITGPDQRVGGGTVSAPDQGHGGTIEGNVAALNRQYEALKSRNDAYNGTGSPSVGLQRVSPPDPWARPGDSWGDSGKRQQEYEGLLRDAATSHIGMNRHRRAAMLQAAQGLAAPGMEGARQQQQGGEFNATNARETQHGLLNYQAAMAGHQNEAAKWGQEFGLKQQVAQQEAQQKAAELGLKQTGTPYQQMHAKQLEQKMIQAQFQQDEFNRWNQVYNHPSVSKEDKATALKNMELLRKGDAKSTEEEKLAAIMALGQANNP